MQSQDKLDLFRRFLWVFWGWILFSVGCKASAELLPCLNISFQDHKKVLEAKQNSYMLGVKKMKVVINKHCIVVEYSLRWKLPNFHTSGAQG